MKMNIKLTALALSAALMLPLAACGAPADRNAPSAQTPGVAEDQKPADERLFADMETVDLDGGAVDSSVFTGNKLTMVNIWNLGCTPCIEETPALGQLAKDYADKGVGVLGLYHTFGNELSDADRQEIRRIMDNGGAEYTQLLTSDSMLAYNALNDMAALPTTYFVDSQGSVVDMIEGSRDLESWKSIVDEMLAKVENNG